MSSAQSDLCFLPCVEATERIRQGDVTPVDLVENLTRRIERLNPLLNAFISLDLDNAREDAERKTRLQQDHPGANLGPLFGVPVAIKDDLAVKGLPYGIGTRLRAGAVAEYDDVTVTRLRRAGAIILGKTNLPEFGHKGTTDNLLGPHGQRLVSVNPWDTAKTAGGSSGGSGAAVAAGLAYLAMGTDIGGSIRIPASFCGIVGLKPSFGMIPRVPAGNAFTLWVTGPMARTVGDVALAMQVLAGADDRDRFSLIAQPKIDFDLKRGLPRPLNVAWCPRPMGGPLDLQVEAVARAALEKLAAEKLITIVERPQPLQSGPALEKALMPLLEVNCLSEFMAACGLQRRADFEAVAPELSPTFAQVLEAAWSVTLERYLAAQAALTEFCEGDAAGFFDGVDLLATPTCATPPFDCELPFGPGTISDEAVDAHLGWTNCWPFNLTGQPALSMPAGWTQDARPLPIGLQWVARRGEDGLILRVAAALESIAPWQARRPAIEPFDKHDSQSL